MSFFVCTVATCKALKVNEAWYDAEENLEPAGPAVTGQDATITAKNRTNGKWSVNGAKALQL